MFSLNWQRHDGGDDVDRISDQEMLKKKVHTFISLIRIIYWLACADIMNGKVKTKKTKREREWEQNEECFEKD